MTVNSIFKMKKQQKIPSLLLNRFLRTCVIEEITTILRVKYSYTVKEQLLFNKANMKSAPDFEQFWTRYGERLT
jgi:hypothetical protein